MATRLATRHYDRALAPSGLTTNEYSILSRLGRLGPLPLGALAARLGVDRSTLSRELAPLVSAGLVEELADAADRRRRVLALGPDGEARVKQARPLWAQAQKEFEAAFGPERTSKLVEELNALVGAEA
jgi:DNA-binding MarR family transcriptional regulator